MFVASTTTSMVARTSVTLATLLLLLLTGSGAPQLAHSAATMTTMSSPIYSPFDGLSLSWHVAANTTTSQDDLVVVMNSSREDLWFGMGFCDEAMDGPMILCGFINSGDASSFDASCHMYKGKRYDASRDVARESLLTYTTPIKTTNGISITFQVKRSEVNADHDGGEQRVIFGNGGFNFNTKDAGPHSGPFPESVKRSRINVLEGTLQSEKRPMKHRHIAWIVTGCVIAAWCVGGIIATYLLVATPTLFVLYAIQVLFIASFLGLFALMIGMAYLDYQDGFQNVALIRAFGDGAAFIFTFILLFATKTFSIGKLVFQSSFERVIPFHVMLGMFLLCVVIVHFAGMMQHYAAANSPGFNFAFGINTPHKNLLAFIGFLLLIILSLIGKLLRRKVYTVFRISHFLLTPTVIVLFIIHHPPMLWQMLPSIIIYICDVIARFVTIVIGGGDVVELSTTVTTKEGEDPVGGILTVKVKTSWKAVDAGQYAFMSISSVGGGRLAHPFTIAEFQPNNSDASKNDGGIATFYIKSMGNYTFTGSLFKSALSKPIPSPQDDGISARLLGPYGTLSVPLRACGHVILASGGIGVTPMLATLQFIANNVTTQDGDSSLASNLQSITMLWVLRDEELFNLIAPRIELFADQIRSATSGTIAVDLQLYLTSKKKKEGAEEGGMLVVPDPINTDTSRNGDDEEMSEVQREANSSTKNNAAIASSSSPSSSSSAKGGRPDVQQIFTSVAESATEASFCNIAGRRTGDKKNGEAKEDQQPTVVGMYTCGPPAFIDSTSTIARKLGMLIHSEVFEF